MCEDPNLFIDFAWNKHRSGCLWTTQLNFPCQHSWDSSLSEPCKGGRGTTALPIGPITNSLLATSNVHILGPHLSVEASLTGPDVFSYKKKLTVERLSAVHMMSVLKIISFFR